MSKDREQPTEADWAERRAIQAYLRRARAEQTRDIGLSGIFDIIDEVRDLGTAETLARATVEVPHRRAKLVLVSYLQKTLEEAGVAPGGLSPKRFEGIIEDIFKVLEDNKRRFNDYFSESLQPLLKHLAETHPLVRTESEIPVDSDPPKELTYYDLLEGLGPRLEGRLRSIGMSEADAATFAHAIMEDFEHSAQAPQSLKGKPQENAAVDLVASTLRVLGGSAASFKRAATIPLPERAPEIWEERDPTRKENPVEFLHRVWAPWLEADVLYQDDIKRLGDDKLVKAVRRYCHQKGLRAADVLPPPRQARLERALVEVEPGSAAEIALRARLENREAAKRWRRARSPAPA